MIDQYLLLKPLIVNYVFDETFTYKDFDNKEVVSVLLSSSSILRKDYVLNRVRNLISKKELKLEVGDEGFEKTSRFIIK